MSGDFHQFHLVTLIRGEYNVKNLKLYPDGPDAMGETFPQLARRRRRRASENLDFYPKLPKILYFTTMKIQKLFPIGPKLETLPR